jgi:hypothetical protein
MDATARAMHYIGWHEAAYGSPTTSDDVAATLERCNGMTAKESHHLLKSLEVKGSIEHVTPRYVSAGWRIKQAAPRGEGQT